MDSSFEYLAFNGVVATSIGLSSWFVDTPFRRRWPIAVLASVVIAVPYLWWDVLVAGRHWWFSPQYTTSWTAWGLPPGEWLFFLTVAVACLFVWEALLRPTRPTGSSAGPTGRDHRPWIGAAFLVAAATAGARGLEYTALAAGSVVIALGVDAWAKTHLFRQRAFHAHLVVIAAFVFVFDGYLAGRPVVLYGDDYYLGWRLGWVPIEDFAYAVGWLGLVHVLYTRWTSAELEPAVRLALEQKRKSWVAGPIRRRLRNYREDFSWQQVRDHVTALAGTPVQTVKVPATRRARVAVVGGGLAGLRAAATLASRGLDVELFERESYLGGKVGAWATTLPSGEQQIVEHGFHAFFRHYYNLYAFLDECEARHRLERMPDYLIATVDGRRFGYAEVATTPLWNLVSLLLAGHFRLRDVLRPRLWQLVALLRYDREATLTRFDELSYRDFADRIGLPDRLRLTFNSFARAFFAPPERMSTGELLKSFHFFFLSHDHGLCYDYLPTDYEDGLIGPIRMRLEHLGVELHVGCSVEQLSCDGEGFLLLAGSEPRRFDAVVLAADVPGAKALVSDAELATSVPTSEPSTWRRQVEGLRVTSSYAVWRVWIDRPVKRPDLTAFFITQRREVLDSITFYERVVPEVRKWADRNQGTCVELHSYCVPDSIEDENELRAAFLSDLHHYLPELAGAGIMHEQWQWRRDFPAFHVGQYAPRPTSRTAVPGLALAGDWVKLPYPAMLMEAACTSGLIAANEVLLALGQPGVGLSSVPRRGMFAPARRGGA